MLLAGAGYRNCDVLARRGGLGAAGGAQTRYPVAALEGSPASRRLVGEAARSGTVGLVLRIRQRVLSGHRRYGDGPARARALARAGVAGRGRFGPARYRVAARDA